MRLLIWTSILLVACTDADKAPQPESPIEVVGYLQSKSLTEASGLARSHRREDLLWAINDDGPPVLHALDVTGAHLGKVKLSKTNNRDWEDLASFSLRGKAYLLVADIGDNERKRKDVRLYVVKEPDPDDKKVKVAWRIEYSYPDGPRDAEAVAVDAVNERILILTKRDIPAVLYELPLISDTKKTLVAKRLGAIPSLPLPSKRDVSNATVTKDWYWQPTGMDIAADSASAVILTYSGVYYYARKDNESWLDALQRRPLGLRLRSLRDAEAIAFGQGDDIAFVTSEKKHAPLLRVDLSSVSRPAPAISIMTFNVQNLFDNVDDPDKDDKAYLPLAAKQSEAHVTECNTIEVESWRDECLHLDWSDDAIEHKLGVLAEAIKQANDGRGADIIALQEIENVTILERLRTEYLADSAYLPAILIEGSDSRGVDVAFLSRLPIVGDAVLHPLVLEDFPDRAGDTRGLLEATFELPDGSLLTGFSVHFPAPFHPTEMRVLAYKHLNGVRGALPPERNVFAAGDFNTSSSEDSQRSMLERFVRPFWTIAHEQCEDCPGTQYYARDDAWSFLDMILFSPAGESGKAWRIVDGSVELANKTAAQVTEDGTPARYHSAERIGVSDHWPLVMAIRPHP